MCLVSNYAGMIGHKPFQIIRNRKNQGSGSWREIRVLLRLLVMRLNCNFDIVWSWNSEIMSVILNGNCDMELKGL